MDWYRFFPWEDHRAGWPDAIMAALHRALTTWKNKAPTTALRQSRAARIAIHFPSQPRDWNDELVLGRYELLWEAGLVEESAPTQSQTNRLHYQIKLEKQRHTGEGRYPEGPRLRAKESHARQTPRHWTPACAGVTQVGPMTKECKQALSYTGLAMAHDHRRILATAMARLRAKIKYRPVVFELLPAQFTLLELQHTVEALAGLRLHKQNFRRLVLGQGLVEETKAQARPQRGRPAQLFAFRRAILATRAVAGTKLPRGG